MFKCILIIVVCLIFAAAAVLAFSLAKAASNLDNIEQNWEDDDSQDEIILH